jgi:hypothetical protein
VYQEQWGAGDTTFIEEKRENHCFEGSQDVPARPSAKGVLEIRNSIEK